MWVAFATRPDACLDLLITPRMTLPAGQVADAIEQRLDRLVKRSRGDEDPNIAYLQGIVATRLYFEELLRVVIPITRGGDRRITTQVALSWFPMARRSMKRKKQRGAASDRTLIGLRLPSGLLARVDRWAASQKDDPSRPEAICRLVELGLANARRAGVPTTKAATAAEMASQEIDPWATRRQPTKNGNSASGGLSSDRKSSGIFAAIAGQTRNPTRLRYDKAALRLLRPTR